ncbi:hypothetical protein CsSME_00000044 [Camellia sinensis var. sinensis]
MAASLGRSVPLLLLLLLPTLQLSLLFHSTLSEIIFEERFEERKSNHKPELNPLSLLFTFCFAQNAREIRN